VQARELCQRFFEEHGAPVIAAAVPEAMDRIAVGLVGGSQAHGNDDEISRDHGWGPGFAVWLSEDDEARFGSRLREVLLDVPRRYAGFHWEMEPQQTCPVKEIGAYIKSYVGFATPPSHPMDWLRIPEAYLFELSPRRIFFDRAGLLTERLKQFDHYPEDVWRKRLSTALGWTAEWGEKHLLRTWRRGDTFTASLYRAQYAQVVMQVVFLLNRQYAPYLKWLHREFASLPKYSTEILPRLDLIMAGSDPEELMEAINGVILQGLRSTGVDAEPVDRASVYPSKLRDFARGLRNSIEDERIRGMDSYCDLVIPPTKTTWTYAVPLDD